MSEIIGRYQEDGSVRRESDGTTIPVKHPWHAKMLAEATAGGGTIVSWESPAPTLDAYRAAIQQHIDQAARARSYDSGGALAGYVASTVPQWAAEAAAFVAWRDAVWVYAYAELDKAQHGQRDRPGLAAFVGELPPVVWPG